MDILLDRLAEHAALVANADGAAVIAGDADGAVIVAASGALEAARGERVEQVPAWAGDAIVRAGPSALPPCLAALAERAGSRACLLAPLERDGERSRSSLLLVAARADAFPPALDRQIVVAAGAIACCAARRSDAERAQLARSAAVTESELRFRAFMDALPAVAWIKDDEGRYTFLNAEYERLWQIRAEAYLGRTDFDIFAPEQAAPMRAHDDLVRREGRILRVEESATSADGERDVWLSTKFPIARPGGRVHVGGIAIDVTARKAMETALREREAVLRARERDLRAIVDGLGEGMLLHRDGKVLYANGAAADALRAPSREALVGLDLRSFSPEGERAQLERDFARVAGGESVAARRRARRLDGTTAVFETHSSRIDLEHAAAVAVVFRDVTEREARAQRQQEHDRLASVGTLAAGVAHEINNPLTAVVMNLEMLREATSELALAAPAARELGGLVDDARAGAERVRRIVRAMRAFTRPAGGAQLAPIRLERPIEEAIELTDGAVRARARLVRRLGPTPVVAADETQLAQVLVNLLTNAAQAIEHGAPQRHRIELASFTDEHGDAVLEVRDDGPGIPTELLGRIFDPFFTTKEAGLGTGLGLSIVHGIVTSIGGEISVRSELGRGATFRVRLPAAGTIEIAEAAPRSRPRRDGRARLLIVDADVALASSIARALKPRFEVETAGSARAALEHVGRRRFDLLLAEVELVDADVESFLRAVEQASPTLAARTIFMRSGGFVDRARPRLEGGGRPWVDKPLALDELTVVLDRVAAG